MDSYRGFLVFWGQWEWLATMRGAAEKKNLLWGGDIDALGGGGQNIIPPQH